MSVVRVLLRGAAGGRRDKKYSYIRGAATVTQQGKAKSTTEAETPSPRHQRGANYRWGESTPLYGKEAPKTGESKKQGENKATRHHTVFNFRETGRVPCRASPIHGAGFCFPD